MGLHRRDPPVEELLAEASWLNGLALRLVRDADLAEDLVQDTWLALLRSPPRPETPLRPWLVHVMRNFVRKLAQRPAPVRAEIDPPAEAEASFEDTELRGLLVQYVDGLREPYRSTVLRRYFDGMSSAQIAAEEGIPAGTVRWRLKAALDDLRQNLDEKHGGDRRAWCLAMAPLLREEIEAATESAAASALTSKALVASCVAAVVLVPTLAGIFFWKPLSTPANAEATAERDAERGAIAPVETSRVGDEPRRSLVAAGDAASPELRMRFLDEKRRAVAGVALEGVRAPAPRSDESGIVRLHTSEIDAARAGDLLHLRLSATSVEGATWNARVRLDASLGRDLGDVTLRAGGELWGYVEGPGGERVAGVEVLVRNDHGDDHESTIGWDNGPISSELIEARVVTDERGEFRAAGVRASRYLRAHARAANTGWGASPAVWMQASEPTGPVIVRLPARRAEAFSVEVRAIDGRPADGIPVVYDAHDTYPRLGYVQDGWLHVNYAPHGLKTLRILDPTGRQGGIDLADVEADRPIQLERQPWLDLDVRDEAGAPIRGASIRVSRAAEWAHNLHRSGGFDEWQGARRLHLLQGVELYVFVNADGYEGTLLPTVRLGSEGETRRVVLKKSATRPGLVLAEGSPAAHAEVSFHLIERGNVFRTMSGFLRLVHPVPNLHLVTDEEGRFPIDLPYGRLEYLVRYQAEGYPPHLVGPIDFEHRSDLVATPLVLQRPGAVRGRVVGSGDVELGGVFIGLANGGPDHYTVRTAHDGTFLFEGIAPGAWYAFPKGRTEPSSSDSMFRRSVNADWEFPANCTVREGQEAYVEIAIDHLSPSVIEGALRIANGSTAGWVAGVQMGRFGDPFQEERTLGTDISEDGRFELHVPDGAQCLFQFVPPGTSSFAYRILDLQPGRNRVDLDLALGSFEGEVAPGVVPTGRPLGVLIRLENGFWAVVEVLRDEAGHFLVENVPCGSARLCVKRLDDTLEDPEGWSWTLAEFEIVRDETTLVFVDG